MPSLRRSLTSSLALTGLALAALAGGLVGCGDDPPPPPPAAVDDPAPDPAPDPEPDPAPDPEPDADPVDDPAATTGEPELVWTFAHEHPVRALAVAPDGTQLAVGEDATYLHQLADGRLVDALVHRHSPEDLAYHPDGGLLAAGLGVYGVSLLDPTSGEETAELAGGFNNRATFGPGAGTLTSADRGGTLVRWDIDAAAPTGELTADGLGTGPMDAAVHSLVAHPDRPLVAATHWDGTTVLWDVDTAQELDRLELAGGHLTRRLVAFTPDGTRMAAALSDDTATAVVVRDLDAGTEVARIAAAERGGVADLDISPDGSLLVIAPDGGPQGPHEVLLADPDDGQIMHRITTLPDGSDRVTAVAVSPDSGHVVLARWDGVVELWRLPGAEPLVAPEPEPCLPLPIPGDVLFDTGSAVLRGEAGAALSELAEQLAAAHPDATLTVIGHTDSRGTAADNLSLSFERAGSVGDWLRAWAAEAGIDGWQVEVDGRGDTELAVPDVDADGAFLAGAGQLNRRVEIEVEAPGCAP